MVLKDREDGQLRLVFETPSEYQDNGENYIHLSGYADFCVCESWYTINEILERFELTDETRNLNDPELWQEDITNADGMTLQCDCPDEDE